MMIRQCLLVLPVHRRSRDRYYSDHEAFVAQGKRKIEEGLAKPFGELPSNTQRSYELAWWWPPWEFNDIIGQVEVGLDQQGRMAGDIFLKRKHFHREDPVRRRGTGRLATHDVLSFCDVAPVEIMGTDNQAYARACERIIKTGQQVVRRRVRTAVVTLPEWPLECIRFPEATRLAKPRW